MLRNLDLDLLRALIAVSETRSFSQAGERLLRSQSAISVQIRRLEDAVGQRLFDRTPRSVALTAQGAKLLGHARRMVSLNDEVVTLINEPDLQGTVRLGTPEDFATIHLPDVLARFAQAHPRVSLEVTCDLTLNLQEGFRSDKFDVVLLKREPSRGTDGVRVWREVLVWVTGPYDVQTSAKIPLVLSPPPCVYRKRATDVLDSANKDWRAAYTCASLAGSIAAVRAGLGITVLPKEMVPSGLRTLSQDVLPDLPDTEIALLALPNLSTPAARLRDHIISSLGHR